MKPVIRCLFILLLSAIQFTAGADGMKIYTRKAKLEDFPDRTLKVVMSGNPGFDAVLKEETASRWVLSPYEFCDAQEYDRLRTSSIHYFLTVTSEDGVVFLSISKGGTEKNTDYLKRPFEVISLPLAKAGKPIEPASRHIAAYLDIIQQFVEAAMESDKTAYIGPEAICVHSRKIPSDMITTVKAGSWSASYTEDTHRLVNFKKGRSSK